VGEMTNFILAIAAAAVLILILQIYVSIHLYQHEQSIGWRFASIILLFGLNVYVYQITKLESRAGYDFDKLTPQERGKWRKVYVVVCAQYMVLFGLFQWLTNTK